MELGEVELNPLASYPSASLVVASIGLDQVIV